MLVPLLSFHQQLPGRVTRVAHVHAHALTCDDVVGHGLGFEVEQHKVAQTVVARLVDADVQDVTKVFLMVSLDQRSTHNRSFVRSFVHSFIHSSIHPSTHCPSPARLDYLRQNVRLIGIKARKLEQRRVKVESEKGLRAHRTQRARYVGTVGLADDCDPKLLDGEAVFQKHFGAARGRGDLRVQAIATLTSRHLIASHLIASRCAPSSTYIDFIRRVPERRVPEQQREHRHHPEADAHCAPSRGPQDDRRRRGEVGSAPLSRHNPQREAMAEKSVL